MLKNIKLVIFEKWLKKSRFISPQVGGLVGGGCFLHFFSDCSKSLNGPLVFRVKIGNLVIFDPNKSPI